MAELGGALLELTAFLLGRRELDRLLDRDQGLVVQPGTGEEVTASSGDEVVAGQLRVVGS